MESWDPFLEPGVLVRHPTEADWGLGQVQSVAGRKRTIDAAVVTLVFVGDDPRG